MIHNYIKKFGALAALFILGLIASNQAVAQTPLVTYSFTGALGNEDSLAADAQPANAKFSKTGRSGATGTAAGNVYNSTGFPTAATVDLNTYISFSGTPFTGYQLNLTSLEVFVQRSSTGPKSVEIRSSANNYATVLKTIDLTTLTNSTETVTLPASHTGLTSRTEFRIYPFNAGAATGTFRIDNLKVFGTVAQTGGTTSPSIGFASSTSNVAENVAGGTTTVQLTIANPSATTASSVNVGLGTGSTAVAGSLYNFTPSTLTWAAGDNNPKTVTVTIINNSVYQGNKTVVLALTNPSTGVTLNTATHTLTILDDEVKPIPTYTVAQVTRYNPTTFAADSLGIKVKVIGTLYGVNQRTTGLQLTLIDATGGVGLFTSSLAGLPAVLPVEGDSIRAIGTVAQFNGLTQITLDSIKVLGTNHMLRKPVIVTGPLTEAHESRLITIANPVTIVDPNQWTNSGSGFNVDVTDGTNTYAMRIVSTSNIFGTTAPTGQFVLTGIGGQFDSSSPFDSGYQIIPRRLTDLRNVTGLPKSELENAISVYPNPVRDVLNLNGIAKNAVITVVNALGQEVAKVPASAKTLNVANLPAGVYQLKVSMTEGVAVKRFVKIN